MNSESWCVGVDGAKSGWIAVWRGNEALMYCVYDSANMLINAHADAQVVGVDIPIGLSESGSREADVQARRFVGGRRACSIFSSPVRGVLDAASQPEDAIGPLMGEASVRSHSRSCRKSVSGTRCLQSRYMRATSCVRFIPRCLSQPSMVVLRWGSRTRSVQIKDGN